MRGVGAVLRAAAGGILFAVVLAGQPSIWGGDYQTTTVGTSFGQSLQVQTGLCIDKPCTQHNVTFSVPSNQLGSFCTPVCTSSTSVTVQNPTGSPIASVMLVAGQLAGGYHVSAVTQGTILYFHETNLAGPAQIITVTGGTPQSAPVGGVYALLQATVTDAYGNPVSGALVTFTAPPGNVTVTFSGSLSANATTNGSGVAMSPPPVASAYAGSVPVTASIAPGTISTSFSLTNTPVNSQVTVARRPRDCRLASTA